MTTDYNQYVYEPSKRKQAPVPNTPQTDSSFDASLLRIKHNLLLKHIGICHRLGYGSGCDCLNECYIVRQHLDTKKYPDGKS